MQKDYGDLKLAQVIYDEYESEGRLRDYPALKLDNLIGWDEKPIGWGDEKVSDGARHWEENEDSAASFKVWNMYFADPHGCKVFNVVELVIKVEVVVPLSE